MEEDIKKELEEIKEDIEQKKEQDKEKQQEEKISEKEEEKAEDLTPEKAETIVEKLGETEKTEEEEKEDLEAKEAPAKKEKLEIKKLLIILGILIIAILCILGIIMGFLLIKNSKKTSHLKRNNTFNLSKSINKLKSPPEKVASVVTSLTKNKLTPKKEVKQVSVAYFKYKLEDFLVPLTSKVFLNTDVILYFPLSDSIKDIMKEKLVYRNIIYDYLKKTSPKQWFGIKQRKKIGRELLMLFKLKGVKPLPKKIEVNGIILKG